MTSNTLDAECVPDSDEALSPFLAEAGVAGGSTLPLWLLDPCAAS